MSDQTELLTRILKLEAEGANKFAEANRLKKEVVKHFCPYREGQFLRIKYQCSHDQMVKICFIKYEPGDPKLINGQWRIQVEPWLKDLSRPCEGRSAFPLYDGFNFEVIDNH